MGPKPKKPPPPPPLNPEDDPKENVTEVEKETFDIQLADIDKKLSRISNREEEMRAGIIEIEEKIIEFKKENDFTVKELEQILQLKEQIKCEKRDEMFFMAEEIKNNIEKHKARIQEQEQKYKNMVSELMENIAELEEEVRIIEDYKHNKNAYLAELDRLQEEMDEAEVQHFRNLFEIRSKLDKAKSKVKKELLSGLLSFSIEFREANQQKIENPCHRVTQENKAFQTVLTLMKMEIYKFEHIHKEALKMMLQCKSSKDRKQDENDKIIARTSIQVYVIKILKRQKLELMATLKGFQPVHVLYFQLTNKVKKVADELEYLCIKIEDTKVEIGIKTEETNRMNEASRLLYKTFRRLKMIVSSSLKIAIRALATRLIPMGGLEEERYLNAEAKLRLFRLRRDNMFGKKGHILRHLFEYMSSSPLSEEDKRLLLTATSEQIDISEVNFSALYGAIEGEPSETDMEKAVVKQTIFESSLTSLPRSESEIFQPVGEKVEEVGEYGEYEGEDEPEKKEVKGKEKEKEIEIEKEKEKKEESEFAGEDDELYLDEEETEEEEGNAD